MRLALFDLDHTLLPIDSADTWIRHLVRSAGLDEGATETRLRHFAAGYASGQFEIAAYLEFQLGLLARFDRADLERWRDDFLVHTIQPQIRPEALALVGKHRERGDRLALVTGTHRFVTQPIGELFGLPDVLAVEPETDATGRFTGRYAGTHTYREGKVAAVENFCARLGTRLADLDGSIFYSDSINDLPLLSQVSEPVVVSPDPALGRIARARGWPQCNLWGTRE